MIAPLIVIGVAFAFLVLLGPAHREYRRRKVRRMARRWTDPGWEMHIPHRYLTPELQRRLRNR